MNLLGMNALDVVLALLVVASAVRAFLRGFFREALSLAGAVAGLVLASWYYPRLAPRLSGAIHSRALAQLAAFVLIFAAVLVAAALLGHLLRRSARAVGLGFMDRLLGGAFGLLRGALLGLSIVLALVAFVPTAGWLKTSVLVPYFLGGAHAVSFVMPSELAHHLADGMTGLKHSAPRWIKQGPSLHNSY